MLVQPSAQPRPSHLHILLTFPESLHQSRCRLRVQRARAGMNKSCQAGRQGGRRGVVATFAKRVWSISGRVQMMAVRHLADARRTFQLTSSSSLYSSPLSLQTKTEAWRLAYAQIIGRASTSSFTHSSSSSSSSSPSSPSSSMSSLKFGS